MASPTKLLTSPPNVSCVLLEYPAPHVLLVTINVPKQMNALTVEGSWEMERLWGWFDQEPELCVVFLL